jgi:putative ABC transport system permease protein
VLIHGRLKPGVSVAQASAAVSAVTSSLAKQYPSTNENKSGIAAPYDAFGNLVKSQVCRHSSARADADRNGVAGRVPEYLRHGAGSQRDARAGTVHPQAIGATRRQLIQYLLSEAIIMAGLGAILASLVLFNLLSLRSLLTDAPLPPQVPEVLKVNLPTSGSLWDSAS